MGEFLRKYRSIISYLFFGICTTGINVISYQICFALLSIQNVPSTCIAWVLAVSFAFVTNKLWVFGSRSMSGGVLLHEIVTFVSCRLLTGVLDVAIMYVAVDVMAWNGLLWKVVANVIVIILNYVASKLVIFGHVRF